VRRGFSSSRDSEEPASEPARWDWQANSLAGVSATQSRYFSEAVTQAETGNLITWNTIAPRFGAIYDLTGDAKTLVKASYSRYFWQLWTDKGSAASVAGDRSLRYQWLDLNGDRNFTTNELGTLLAVDDPATRQVTIDPDLKPTRTDEFVAGITRELMADTSITASFMSRKDTDLDWRINTALSPADYTPVVGTDPGPDGVLRTADDGGALTFYEISAAKRTLSPNFITTRPGFEQVYRGLELTVNRRLTNRWQAVGSVTIGQQKETYGPGASVVAANNTAQFGNPNGHIIRLRETGDDPAATGFAWDIFLFGADSIDADPANVNLSGLTASNDFSSPDGLWFARPQNASGLVKPILWIETDDGAFTDRTNNQMLVAIPGSVGDGSAKTITNVGAGGATATQATRVGAAATDATLRRFLVGPIGCEITGVDSTPDGRTLFVGIQHPGEEGTTAAPDSHWPDSQATGTAGATVRPRSAIIAITKNDGGVVGL